MELGCNNVTIVNGPPSVRVEVTAPDVRVVSRPALGSTILAMRPNVKFITDPPHDPTVIVVPVIGPQGPPGAGSGSSFYYEHVQPSPSAGWLVTHALGKRPNVAVIIDDETSGVPVQHLDANTVYIPFANPQTGRAICS